MQQINSTGNLHWAGDTNFSFFIEKLKETALRFLQESLKVV